jgi:glycosyltransferase involved in cell wall biosynthesis
MTHVSVVVATRNRRDLLAAALASVDAQRFDDLEVIVADDGSTDGTADWLRANRPDVRVVTSAGAGAAAARNRGVEQARGGLIAFLDDDDRWLPGYLAAQVANLDANRDAALSHADHLEVDPAGTRRRPGTASPLPGAQPLVRLLAGCFVHTMSTVVCRRAAFDRLDERLAVVHDLDWYARVLAGGGRIAHLERVLVERGVPGGLVVQRRRWFAEERTVIARALADAPRDRRRVRACRSLFFAKLGLAAGDVPFGLARLGEALALWPQGTVRLAARRLGDAGTWRPAAA